MTPLSCRSEARVLGPLKAPAGARIEDEAPLFAASRDFALAHGGPITRAFLEALPPEWSSPLIVDSSLVWLTPGIAHGLHPVAQGGAAGQRAAPHFFHELYPGVESGVRGAANRNGRALHRFCLLGLPAPLQLAEGTLSFPSAAEANPFWFPSSYAARDSAIAARLDAGTLALRELPMDTVLEAGWGALLRAQPARAFGFQLFLRATLHDVRPAANGRRNASML